GKSQPVDPETLFQAASLSKPVTALAVMRLVEQGRLKLDTDVNEYLTSWKLPDDLRANGQKVTLRMLLSHTAGISVHGFIGYRAGARLPNLIEVLDGRSPANSAPIRIENTPGEETNYSGGGTTIAQQLLIDVQGTAFLNVLAQLVLEPCSMQRSTFEQPLPTAWTGNAAQAHLNGRAVPGGWFVYPEMAAAGLWTTPSDVASFLLTLSRALDGESTVVEQATVEQMMTPVKLANGQPGQFGVGPVVRGEGEGLHVWHNGGNVGFQCYAVLYPRLGKGAVVMTNSSTGMRCVDEILASIAENYEWPDDDYRSRQRRSAQLTPEQLEPLVGNYEIEGNKTPVQIKAQDGRLSFQMLQRPAEQFVPASEVAFFSLTSEKELRFETDAAGNRQGVVSADGKDLFRILRRSQD
ncbi:MAG: beta-lactamase family protein, partial [Pirellulales bacterium]|nr:beta-lactamase family protein [Pirellulales bacterium]